MFLIKSGIMKVLSVKGVMYLADDKKKKRRGKGEGTIYQRGQDKLWVGQAVVGYNPLTGKPKRKTVYGKTRSEVVQKLAKISVLVTEGKYTDSNLTVQQWLDIWLIDYMRNTLRPNTYESYEMFIRLHINPQIGKVKLKDLTTNRIQKLYNLKIKEGRVDSKGGLAPRSVERIHTVLHKALEQATAERKIPYNPAKATTLPPRNKKEIRVLTREEQDQFEVALEQERLGTAFLVGLYAGLRRGEVLGLKWQDIDLDNYIITVKQALLRVKDKETKKSELKLDPVKTKKSNRTVPFPEELAVALKKYKIKQVQEKLKAGPMYQDQNLVFCTTLGTFIEPRNFNRTFSRIIKNVDIKDFSLHGLRHTYTTRLSEIGINVKIRQELLGHESSNTTEGYNHVLWEMMRMAIDQLNEYMKDRKNPSTREG